MAHILAQVEETLLPSKYDDHLYYNNGKHTLHIH